jgi:DNA-binding transcriptional ArsR family regulator
VPSLRDKLNQLVEYPRSLDATYHAISHPVRRQVLERLSSGAARISDLAAERDISFAAVSKHVQVLELAGLIKRKVSGREHWLSLDPANLEPASQWLSSYRKFWQASLDRLEQELRKRPR